MSSSADKSEVKVFKFGEESLSDVIFVVDGKEFHCHRMFLAARSSYFAALFSHGFKEESQERIDIVADHLAFKHLMEILYNGYFEDEENLFMCNYFNVRGIEEAEFNKELWTVCYDIFEIADRFLVLDSVRRVLESHLMNSHYGCPKGKNNCTHCGVKLLLALQFKMDKLKRISTVARATIGASSQYLKSVQKEFICPMDGIEYLAKLA